MANERYDPEKLMKSVIGYLARRTAVRGTGVPLWSVVADMTAYGSTSGTRICEQFGFDPDTYVREPVFVDWSREVLNGWCPKCQVEFHREEGCPNGCDPDEALAAATT